MDLRSDGLLSCDGRGKFERDWLLGNEDLLWRFKKYMRKFAMKDALTVDACQIWVTDGSMMDRGVVDRRWAPYGEVAKGSS